MLLLAEYNLGTLLSRQHLRHSGDLTDIFVPGNFSKQVVHNRDSIDNISV